MNQEGHRLGFSPKNPGLGEILGKCPKNPGLVEILGKKCRSFERTLCDSCMTTCPVIGNTQLKNIF